MTLANTDEEPAPMTIKVVPMCSHSNNSRHASPEQVLQEALTFAREEGSSYSKALVLFLDDTDGAYNTQFFNAGLKASAAITLLEVTKVKMLQNMNYIPREESTS